MTRWSFWALVAILGAPVAANAQLECSTCDDYYFIPAEDWIHQLTGEGGYGDWFCAAGGGHPIHNCSGDDQGDWTGGDCTTHQVCIQSDLIAATLRSTRLTVPVAKQLAMKYPRAVQYVSRDEKILIRNCAGRLVGVVLLRKAEPQAHPAVVS